MDAKKTLMESIIDEMRKEDGEPIVEPSINRVESWIRSRECAFITAWRTQYKNITDNTFKPTHLRNGETFEAGDDFIEGDAFTADEKRFYNQELKATLLRLGYGVTKVRGVFREEGFEGCDPGQEESFLVVNLRNDPDFKRNLFRLSEYYNQDCFMYSPPDSDEWFNIGTNAADFPGYGNESPAGSFQRNVLADFMPRIGNVGFAFGDKKKMHPGNRPSFYDRKKYRVEKNQSKMDKHLDEQFDTFGNYNIGAKQCICQCCEHVIDFLNL